MKIIAVQYIVGRWCLLWKLLTKIIFIILDIFGYVPHYKYEKQCIGNYTNTILI